METIMETKEPIASSGVKIKYLMSFISIIFAVYGIIFLASNVIGQTIDEAGIKYPIAELGNCANKAACGTYCDKPKNAESCLNFAEKNNLMSKEEIKVAKNFIAAGGKGPGGCASKDSCEAYCNDISRIDECVSFAEKNNLMPPEELAEAKKIQAAISRGVKPPPCGNKKQCDSYCEDPAHMEECVSFAAEAGFMQGKELEDAQKMLAAVRRGVKPPSCKGKEACDEYCSAPANLEVCMNFAVEAGFMNEREKADAQKMLAAVKKGAKPPKCKGKEDCDAYCGQEEHFEECLSFAEVAGFMSAEDAVMARKTGGKGPGGCKGKEECEAFCKDNQEACFNFAKENGMIPEEELKKMAAGKEEMQKALLQAPPEVLECLRSEMGADFIEKLKNGTAMPSKEIGDRMGDCFEKVGPREGAPGQGGMMPPGQSGPGGCTTPEECKAYCESHQDECQKFQPGAGAINPGDQAMPPQGGQTNGIIEGNAPKQIPAEMVGCIKEKMGDSVMEKILSGQMTPEIGLAIKECGEQFRNQMQQNGQVPPAEMVLPERILQGEGSPYVTPPPGFTPPPGDYPQGQLPPPPN